MSNLFNKSNIIVSCLVILIIFQSFDFSYSIHSLIYTIAIGALLNLLRNISIRFILPELIGFITFLMYLVAPALMFDIGAKDYLHPNSSAYEILAVDPNIYYMYALPSTILFYLAVTLSFKKYRNKNYILSAFEKIRQRYNIIKIVKIFIVISFVSNVLSGKIDSLNFLFYLGSQLTTIVLILSLLLKSKKTKKVIFIAVFVLLLTNVISTGMFSNLVFSFLFYGLFYVLINNLSTRNKIILPVLASLFLILLQTFKGDFRNESWSGNQNVDKTQIAINVVSNISNSFNADFLKISSIPTLVRLNMAWHCSRVIKYVPNAEPYAYGSTIVNIFTSLIPRVLWPDKPELSGNLYLEKYGKYTPQEGTSMSIGQIGESYANFGFWGGIIFFGFYGYLVAYTLYYLIKKTKKGALFLFFTPVIMYAMTKPEVILSKSFNTAFKGIIFVYIIMFFVNRYCRKKAVKKNQTSDSILQ